MLEQPYPCRYPLQRSPINLDPGRFRVESFFKSIYGHSPADVQKKLTSVRLGQTTFQISTCGNVHESLQTIFQQIEALLEKRPDLRSYISPSGGSFKWRTIAGTTRLSPHAFGIAVDINPRLGPYWRWGSPDEKWLNNKKFLFPMEIVDIFEQNGFIWGGRWYHYDFMHFEFRPELFLKSLYRAES
jgi:peptidoglycan L-alanyl-D-glutamate endopeptidase CwlK